MISGDLLKWITRCLLAGIFAWSGWMTKSTIENKTDIAVMKSGILNIVGATARMEDKLDRLGRRGR